MCIVEKHTFVGTHKHNINTGGKALLPRLKSRVSEPRYHENLSALYSVYRKSNGIVSLEDVQSIPKKYNIGK